MRIASAIFLLLVLTAAVACEPGPTITYVNETDKTVIVYTADDRGPEVYDAVLERHSTVRVQTTKIIFEDVVIGRDRVGNILFRKEITWADLKAQGFRFVITEEMLSPTPTEER